jgi:hypothetical protein
VVRWLQKSRVFQALKSFPAVLGGFRFQTPGPASKFFELRPFTFILCAVRVTKATIALIERLCHQGESNRSIARQAHCAESTVRKVLAGTHRLQADRFVPTAKRNRAVDPDWGVKFSPVKRQKCPNCGGLITEKPCRLCLLDRRLPGDGDAS